MSVLNFTVTYASDFLLQVSADGGEIGSANSQITRQW